MRAGIHTGRPQRIGGDWLGVDVNIAARVMERAVRGGLIISETTLEEIPPENWSDSASVSNGCDGRCSRRGSPGPPDLVMYRVKTRT